MIIVNHQSSRVHLPLYLSILPLQHGNKFQAFKILTTDGSEWPTSCSNLFTTEQEARSCSEHGCVFLLENKPQPEASDQWLMYPKCFKWPIQHKFLICHRILGRQRRLYKTSFKIWQQVLQQKDTLNTLILQDRQNTYVFCTKNVWN